MMTLGHDRNIELMRQGQARQGKLDRSSLLKRYPHVLDEVPHQEPRFEISSNKSWTEIADGPGPCCSLADDVDHGLLVQAQFDRIQERLTDTDHRARNKDLVAHLGMLSCTGRAHVRNVFSHELEQGKDSLKDFLFPPNHNGQGGISRSNIPA